MLDKLVASTMTLAQVCKIEMQMEVIFAVFQIVRRRRRLKDQERAEGRKNVKKKRAEIGVVRSDEPRNRNVSGGGGGGGGGCKCTID